MQMNMPYHKCFKLTYISADWLLRNFQHHLFISSFVASLSIPYCFIIDMLIETPLGKRRNSVLIMYPVTFLICSLIGQNDSWIDLARGIGIYTYSTEQHGPLQQLSLHKSSPPESPKPFSTSLFHSRWSC